MIYPKHLVFYAILFVIYIFLMPTAGLEWDTFCWTEWTEYILINGLENVYKSSTDYLPLLHYILFGLGKILGSITSIEMHMHYLKIITLVFDFLAGFLLLRFCKDKFKSPSNQFYLSLFFFLNIPMFYNTLIWGQVDGILSLFVFAAVYFALKEKIIPSLIFIVLALNFKLQAIIFLPLFGLLLLPSLVNQFSFRNLFSWIVLVAALQIAIISPFLFNGDFDLLMKVVNGSVNKFPFVSMNAFNMWDWFISGYLMQVPDTGLFLGHTYQSWGKLLFFVTSFFALWPLIHHTLKKLMNKFPNEFSVEQVLLIATLIPLLFFFFNTQMHERYTHPALIFIIAYSIRTRNFIPAIIICSAYVLNLERVHQYLHLHKYGTLIFSRIFISILYFIGILLLFFELYGIRQKLFPSKKAVQLVNGA